MDENEGMRGHYTQSARSRNLKIGKLWRLSEAEAYETLKQIRFAASNGDPICPFCGCDRISDISTRRRFKCRECKRQFSVTSGTVWDRHKLPYYKLLLLAAYFVREANGVTAISLSRLVECNPMTAFVATHKLREAMALESVGVKLEGVCEADGCRIGEYVRPYNNKHRKYRTSPNLKIVGAVRERKGRVLTQIVKHEKEFVEFIRKCVSPVGVLHTDDASHWERLGETHLLKTINHSQFYSYDGACTNQVESFFGRLRRAECRHVHISGVYADLYAIDFAWRETHCKASDADKYLRLLSLCLQHPMSRRFKGYWQNRRGNND